MAAIDGSKDDMQIFSSDVLVIVIFQLMCLQFQHR